MSRLDTDIYYVKRKLKDLEEYVGDGEGYTILGDIESTMDDIENAADSWEDEAIDVRSIERTLSNLEDAVSDYVSEINRELP
jgi:predicted  nucleic acid-binding Zn-ribbon protein